MELLKQRILKDGTYDGEGIVLVDSFINHQVDPVLLREMGLEFKRLFAQEGVTKILTIESSGIAIAAFTAYEMSVPFVFAKKYNSRNLTGEYYQSEVYSYTKQQSFIIRVAKNYINENDNVLIVDDFLANGRALLALMEIVQHAGAHLAGCGIVIEKSFQPGGALIRSMGVKLHSLAVIESIKQGKICFKQNI